MAAGERAVIKADIQGSELLAFDERTVRKFLTGVDVPLIQMEWVIFSAIYAGALGAKYQSSVDSPKEVRRYIAFAKSMNYRFADVYSKPPDHDRKSWPNDILPLKKPK